MFRIDEDAEKEMAGSTDRACAIIGGSYLEERLLKALKRHLAEGTASDQKWLLEQPGPIQSFEARIRLATVTGLISPEFADDLMILKYVRNQFAHRIDLRSFEDQSISDRLKNLKKANVGIMLIEHVEKRTATARERFENAIGEASAIIGQRRRPSMPEPSF